jgi:D-beta-D-heptose 7-phosphate kinase/D-beta-D-heptose 1-phosphate adenosyltransferase
MVVFTNGCFDILHAGHVDYLSKAKEMGDYLIVGLNSDESVKKIKGDKRPINDQYSRMKVLEALRCVDEVLLFSEETPYELIKKIRPDILVKGGDYKIEDIVGSDLVKRIEIIKYLEGYSTTNIIKKIMS